MADEETPAKKWKLWLPPKTALAQCSSMGERTAIATIYQRLCSGLIKSIARKTEIGRKITEYFQIDSSIWARASEGIYANSVWHNNGDMSVSIRRSGSIYDTVDLHLFSIRFDPAGIDEIQPPASPPIDADRHEENAQEKGPPVSTEHLNQWQQLYERAYGGTPQDTRANQLASARGMFPGKSISRERIRALFEARKPGRKTGPGAK